MRYESKQFLCSGSYGSAVGGAGCGSIVMLDMELTMKVGMVIEMKLGVEYNAEAVGV